MMMLRRPLSAASRGIRTIGGAANPDIAPPAPSPGHGRGCARMSGREICRADAEAGFRASMIAEWRSGIPAQARSRTPAIDKPESLIRKAPRDACGSGCSAPGPSVLPSAGLRGGGGAGCQPHSQIATLHAPPAAWTDPGAYGVRQLAKFHLREKHPIDSLKGARARRLCASPPLILDVFPPFASISSGICYLRHRLKGSMVSARSA